MHQHVILTLTHFAIPVLMNTRGLSSLLAQYRAGSPSHLSGAFCDAGLHGSRDDIHDHADSLPAHSKTSLVSGTVYEPGHRRYSIKAHLFF